MNTTVPFQAEKPIFHKLENIADMAQLTREEREYYHISLDSYRTNMACMEHERDEGRAEGRAEGLAEGRAEGFAKGIEQANIKTIKRLSAKGMTPGEIAEMLDLDLSFVNQNL